MRRLSSHGPTQRECLGPRDVQGCASPGAHPRNRPSALDRCGRPPAFPCNLAAAPARSAHARAYGGTIEGQQTPSRTRGRHLTPDQVGQRGRLQRRAFPAQTSGRAEGMPGPAMIARQRGRQPPALLGYAGTGTRCSRGTPCVSGALARVPSPSGGHAGADSGHVPTRRVLP